MIGLVGLLVLHFPGFIYFAYQKEKKYINFDSLETF
jgi:cbb3-type cytochrome oxidase subunit 3